MDQGCFEPISFEPFGAGHFADLVRSDVSDLADSVTESTLRSSCAAVADESRTISFELWCGLFAASLGGHLHSLWGGCSSAPFCLSYSTSRHRVEFGTSKYCRFLGLEAIAQRSIGALKWLQNSIWKDFSRAAPRSGLRSTSKLLTQQAWE